ncbi:sigma N (sigma 54) factor of RNA polymerase [Alishewanella agri BL06]|jgi:RNA polymerase sigma-54 factor|uniref:RNA polymerase sigma-54 factor n=1 Tax=Alishewanella agri BL06 TaxID=1195246 RepID=I8UA87_9ALTE|nr:MULTISPECIES: RNA polymerase factor sigma-54 [Alishewanella]EIW88883.1 sigma N (sigma 54) factor of RNA polymerase [Alishewanella agri BL06]KRS21761.1 RNA polymerase factor sigma-54 [Alishewanella sp. WH16-1]OZB40723.1 MAG: RNA polymerase sigma-54 factor [Alishewanella sp. 34-51-39]
MKPSLQLRLGQQLTMTPQLQQAIRLLQLSTIELQQEVQEALDANPLLEGDDDYSTEHSDTDLSLANLNRDTPATDSASDDNDDFTDYTDHSERDSSEAMTEQNIQDDLPLDNNWDDLVSAAPVTSGALPDDDMVYQGETTETLQDYLRWQMELTPFSATDRAIAEIIIEAVDETGLLTISCEDILESLQLPDVEADEVEAVLKRIQLFDPVGVAARSVQECLLVQLRQFDPATPYLNDAKQIISEYTDFLANRDFRSLMRVTKLKEEELKEVMRLIHSLNPRPGADVIRQEQQYIIPDVVVSKVKGRWQVELNPDAMPKVRINQQYAALSRTARNSADSQFIRSHLQEAKWFLKSLESRNETLLKVASCIVQQQQAFFEHGEEAMKPMVLNDVAEMVSMHESTISRVTTQKYMHTPRGIFELKFFFSSHVSTESGGECSSTAIRAFIKKLVAAENPAKPLSDSRMAEILSDQGINVARRTIAKYRESLFIPPSNQRKTLL